MVKRLRHQPLTLKTWVRFPYESPSKKKQTSLMGVCFFFVCASHKTEPTCANTEVYFFSNLFAQGVRIPPLAVSCVIRRVGRRIANSRTCLPLAFYFVPIVLFDLSLLIICSLGNIPLPRYAPESINRNEIFILAGGVRFLFFGDSYLGIEPSAHTHLRSNSRYVSI